MAPKAAKEAAKKKAAKQKKVLIGLGLLLGLALIYAYTTLSGQSSAVAPAAIGSATPTTPSAAAPTPATSTPTVTPTGTPTALTLSPGIAASPVGSLRSFTALGWKDPFHDGGPSGASSDSSKTPPPPSGKGKGKGKGAGSPSKQPSAPLTGAVISLNGNKLALALGAKFGHAPGLTGVWLFRLDKVTATTALIDVVGTQQQYTLHVRQTLTLAQPGGWTYALTLEPVGTAAGMTVQQTAAGK